MTRFGTFERVKAKVAQVVQTEGRAEAMAMIRDWLETLEELRQVGYCVYEMQTEIEMAALDLGLLPPVLPTLERVLAEQQHSQSHDPSAEPPIRPIVAAGAHRYGRPCPAGQFQPHSQSHSQSRPQPRP